MTKQQIQNSMDYKLEQRSIKTIAAMWGAFSVLVLFVMVFAVTPGKELWLPIVISLAVCLGLGLIACVPPMIVCAVHMSKLTKTADGFQPSVAVLDTIESSGILRGRLSSYKVKFEIDGQQYTVSTSPLFGVGIMSVYLLEDYNNKTVDIAYNPQTDRVIVMGIVGEDKQA